MLISVMSDIYNLDFCIEEFLQMNFYIVWNLWIGQNVIYAIIHLEQLSMQFFFVRKYIHCGDRLKSG